MKKWLIILFLTACGPSKKEATLVRAATIHNEATKIGHQASMGVSQLKGLEGSLEMAQLDSLNAIIKDLTGWYESLVEVPGYQHQEHDHDHSGYDHAHDHEKNYLEGLSAEEVLAIQLELKKEIAWMNERINNLKHQVKNKGNTE